MTVPNKVKELAMGAGEAGLRQAAAEPSFAATFAATMMAELAPLLKAKKMPAAPSDDEPDDPSEESEPAGEDDPSEESEPVGGGKEDGGADDKDGAGYEDMALSVNPDEQLVDVTTFLFEQAGAMRKLTKSTRELLELTRLVTSENAELREHIQTMAKAYVANAEAQGGAFDRLSKAVTEINDKLDSVPAPSAFDAAAGAGIPPVPSASIDYIGGSPDAERRALAKATRDNVITSGAAAEFMRTRRFAETPGYHDHLLAQVKAIVAAKP